MRALIPLLLLTGLAFQAAAQIDTEFWFVAPYAEPHQPGQRVDRVFRIATYGQEARVTISQPANSQFRDTTIALGANTSFTFNVTPFMPRVEAAPPNQTLNYGFLLRSTAPVSVYYEITALEGPNDNPEIFALKGRNALGTEFYTPFQLYWANIAIEGKPTYSAIDIVATADGTEVTITPTRDLLGHPAGQPFTIRLNRGQVYSVRAAGVQFGQQPSGSRIVSNKPIAVTLIDDSIRSRTLGVCVDQAGDQIMPVSQLGTEYILVRGFLYDSNDRAYVVATADGTQVRVNGAVAGTINRGQTLELKLAQASQFVQLNHPAYVWHISGYGCEVGGAVLPALECRGSRQLSFVRSTAENFGLILVTRAEWRDGFVLNGRPVAASRFAVVPSTNNQWYAAALEFNTTEVPVNAASLIANTKGIFQMGLLNGGLANGARYGYFSDFQAFKADLGADISECEGEMVVLSPAIPDASRPGATYRWQNGSREPTLSVQTPGMYAVTVDAYGCQSSDTIEVEFKPYPIVELGDDRNLCPGETALLDATFPNATYRWQDGTQTPTYPVTREGRYQVDVTLDGCTASDEINITLTKGRPVELGPDTTICPGGTLRLNAAQDCATYRWSDGSTDSVLIVTRTGTYAVTVTVGSETFTDAIKVDQLTLPAPLLPADTVLCEGGELLLSLPAHPWQSIAWSDGSTGSDIEVLSAGRYRVTATDRCGQTANALVNVAELAPPGVQIIGPADTILCSDEELILDATQEGVANYEWSDGSRQPTLPVTATGRYRVTWSNACGMASSATVNVLVQDCPCLIEIPNAFTPNGDGKNDQFRVLQVNCDFSNFQLQVFNRWGKRVFATADFSQGWDGSDGGKAAVSDVYIYMLDYTADGERKSRKGDVTLIR